MKAATIEKQIRRTARKDGLQAYCKTISDGYTKWRHWWFSDANNYLQSPEEGLDDQTALEWITPTLDDQENDDVDTNSEEMVNQKNDDVAVEPVMESAIPVPVESTGPQSLADEMFIEAAELHIEAAELEALAAKVAKIEKETDANIKAMLMDSSRKINVLLKAAEPPTHNESDEYEELMQDIL